MSTTGRQRDLRSVLKRLGFTRGNQIKLYGHEFQVLGDPIVIGSDLVLLDAAEKRSGQARRVRIPRLIVNMAKEGRTAA